MKYTDTDTDSICEGRVERYRPTLCVNSTLLSD